MLKIHNEKLLCMRSRKAFGVPSRQKLVTILTRGCWVFPLGLLLVLVGVMTFAPEVWAGSEGSPRVTGTWIGITILALFVIVSLLVFYMIYLQRQFLKACREEKQLTTFFQTPAGLPAGTVRSILTLIIVVFSLYLLTLAVFGIGGEFPKTLAAILSTIIGFYFGSRTATPRDGAMTEELDRTRQQRNEAVAAKDEGKAGELLKKVAKNITLVKTVTGLLPKDMQKKYGGTLDKLGHGVEVAKELFSKGDMSSAAEKAGEMFNLFKGENPLRDTIFRAAASFGKAAGGIVPPLAIISTVVGISTKLIGASYAKWKARILNTPFSPAVVPLKVVDADTGFVLMLQSPIFKEVFRSKLTAQDRSFMETAVRAFLTQEAPELWEKYGEYFDSREAFDQGLQQFRMAAANLELEGEIESTLLQETGGYAPLITAIDKIHDDEEAGADLDLLMEVVEGLQKANEPVKSIFDKVRKEVES